MKNSLKLEELALFVFCIFLFSLLDFEWWWFLLLLFLPDVGMLGYIINPKIGAFTYNILHHRLLACLVAVYSLYYENQYGQLIAIILFAHISLDRALSYGLKYKDGFQHTHLGLIGKN